MNPHRTSTRAKILVTCGLAVAIALGSLTTLAKATTPGKNGLLAFTRYRLQNAPLWSEIFVANPDGSGARRVSHSPTAVEDDQAHWSPDGSWIVFDRCTANAPCSVWLVRPDGTGQRRLTPSCHTHAACYDEGGPSFTPDGRHIVLTHEWGQVKHTTLGDQIEHSAIAERNLDGCGLKIIRRLDGYQGDLLAPRISPNGKLIVFDRSNSTSARPAGGDALFVTGVNGGAPRQLTSWRLSAGSPDWSPDGKQVLFKRNIQGASELTPGTNLYTIGVNGTGLRRVTNVDGSHYVLAGSFSPDGTSIVFATDAEATANPNAAQPFADVFTMRIGGTNFKPATRTPNLDGWPTWGSLP